MRQLFDILIINKIVIPYGVITIGKKAFFGSPIFSVTLPSTVTTICEGAFAQCGLSEITLPEGLTSIGDNAFKNCLALRKISLYAGKITIGVDAFLACSHAVQFTMRVRLRVLLSYDWVHYNSCRLFFTFDFFCEFLSILELVRMTRVSKCFYSAIVTRSRHDFLFERLGRANISVIGNDDDADCLAIVCSCDAALRSCLPNATDEIQLYSSNTSSISSARYPQSFLVPVALSL